LEDHVHRAPRLSSRRSLNLRIGKTVPLGSHRSAALTLQVATEPP
jgi:hypothetical protein